MSQSCKSPKTFIATGALEAFRRVKLTTSSGTAVEYADQSDSSTYIGFTLAPALIGAAVAIALKGDYQTFKAVASEAFAVGASLYAADDGKVSDTSSGDVICTALEVSGANNDVVEVLADSGSSSAPGAGAIAVYSATAGGVPFVIQTVCTAAGAEDEVVIAAMPRKAKIIDAWMIARATDAANVTLANVANDFTGAVAIGGVDDVIVPFDTIIAEYDEVAAGALVKAGFSAAGSAEIFLMCLPIA